MASERHIIEIGLAKLRRYIRALQEGSSRKDLPAADEGLPEPQEQTFRRLIVLTTNLANHMIGRWRLPTPEDPLDIFAVLGQAGILPVELVEDLREVALLRDKLAHGYEEIPAEEVPAWVPHRLRVFADFAGCAEKTLLGELQERGVSGS